MAYAYAYIDTGGTYLTLGSKGIRIEIKTGIGSYERKVGSLYVGKSGIRWLPKRKRTTVKGSYGTGVLLSWKKLNEPARKSA